ncbi:MAG: nuclear transport factor 2 family protein [Bacteroidetes bacterium]|nr:nuclear transport factor 2 family protein [Bacteroidota bacterium]
MKTAKELLLSYIELMNNSEGEKAIDLFADDAVFELPYLASAGLPHRWEGREVLQNFLKNLPKTFPGFRFKNVVVHIDTPDQAFGEYEADAIVAKTGKPYHQHYMGRVVAKDGKIVLIREALNMHPVITSMTSSAPPASPAPRD